MEPFDKLKKHNVYIEIFVWIKYDTLALILIRMRSSLIEQLFEIH